MNIEVKDSKVDDVLHALPQAIEAALEAISLQAEGYVQLLTPVDTGRLRNSITHKIEGDTAYIGTNVEYAPYVEYNENAEHKTGQAHYLRDGILNHKDEYSKIAAEILKNV